MRASCVRRFAVRVLECRRFGLGIVLGFFLQSTKSRERGSSHWVLQSQVALFRFVPQLEQSPLQSSLQSGFIGSDR